MTPHTRRRSPRQDPEPGRSWSTSQLDPPPARKIVALKQGEVAPPGSQYLTFALKKDVPHFFFLVDQKATGEKPRIGFRLGE